MQKQSSLIIVTDVNMTSKRAFLQKVTVLPNSKFNHRKKRFYLNKIMFSVFFYHKAHVGSYLVQNAN